MQAKEFCRRRLPRKILDDGEGTDKTERDREADGET